MRMLCSRNWRVRRTKMPSMVTVGQPRIQVGLSLSSSLALLPSTHSLTLFSYRVERGCDRWNLWSQTRCQSWFVELFLLFSILSLTTDFSNRLGRQRGTSTEPRIPHQMAKLQSYSRYLGNLRIPQTFQRIQTCRELHQESLLASTNRSLGSYSQS
jgi:hypothetical protein